jgi:hypothetical protein
MEVGGCREAGVDWHCQNGAIIDTSCSNPILYFKLKRKEKEVKEERVVRRGEDLSSWEFKIQMWIFYEHLRNLRTWLSSFL